MESLSLYFHIPFCKKKCPYCHFYSLKHSEKMEEAFFKSLHKEWESKQKLFLKNTKLVSIYFGGGTPSICNVRNFEKVLCWIQKKLQFSSSIEITLEINPSDVSKEKINDLFSIGINRLSLGVQTFNTTLLSFLCRTHQEEIFFSLDTIFEKFQNVSIDLMYDLPKQTQKMFQKDLYTALKWPITHLSLYNLVVEPHTLFYFKKKNFEKNLPSDKESLAMLKDAVHILKLYELERYEISAFAKKNYQSQHNIGYWMGRPFLGFGPSAFSYFSKKRFQNVCNLETYVKRLQQNTSPIDFEEDLSFPKNFIERLVIGLRHIEGVDLKKLEKEFLQKTPSDLWEKLKKLQKEKFVKIFKNRVFLEEKGKNFYDTLAQELL